MPEVMAKRCEWCGDEFKPQRGTARFCCDAHRKAWNKAAKKHEAEALAAAPIGLQVLKGGKADSHMAKGRAVVAAAKAEDEAPDEYEPGPVETATQRELTKHGRLETSDGAKAMKLARRIDLANLADTGSNMAALSKAHDVAMDRALHGVAADADAADPVANLADAMAAIVAAAVPEAVAS